MSSLPSSASAEQAGSPLPVGHIDPALSSQADAALLDAHLAQLYESALAAGQVPLLSDSLESNGKDGQSVDGAGPAPSPDGTGGDGGHLTALDASLFDSSISSNTFLGDALGSYAVGPSAGPQNQSQASFAFNQPSAHQQGHSDSAAGRHESSVRSSTAFDMTSFLAREQMNLYAAQQWNPANGTAAEFAAFANAANGSGPSQPPFNPYPRGSNTAAGGSSLRSTSTLPFSAANYPAYNSGPSGEYPDAGPSKRKAEDEASGDRQHGRFRLPPIDRRSREERDDSPPFTDRSYESSLSPAGSNYSDGGTPPARSRKKARHSLPKVGNENRSRKVKITLDHIPPELLANLPPALPRAPPADKPFGCDQCDKSFTRKNDLERHKGIHQDARPHKCETCGKAFRQPWHLKNHAVVHTGEQPYGCELCDTRFTESGALRRHRRTHLDERPYPCLSCDRRFKRKDGLKKHVESMHNGPAGGSNGGGRDGSLQPASSGDEEEGVSKKKAPKKAKGKGKKKPKSSEEEETGAQAAESGVESEDE